MKEQIIDRKSKWTYAIFSRVNKLALGRHFRKIEVINRELIPTDKPFILVSNHISRWDGLVVYNVIDRPSNFMVHPNELRGLQGIILRSMGAFPASARADLHNHIDGQLSKGEGVVIFPEGDIYRDEVTHPFKTGAARLALNLARNGRSVPIIPVAISYEEDGTVARVIVAPPIEPEQYLQGSEEQPSAAVRALTDRIQREVCHLRLSLGKTAEAVQLFVNKQQKAWSVLLNAEASSTPAFHA